MPVCDTEAATALPPLRHQLLVALATPDFIDRHGSLQDNVYAETLNRGAVEGRSSQ